MQEENNKLFVGNISYQTNDASLKESFNAIDGVEVVDAKVITDRDSGRSKGFGFIEMSSDEEASRAISQYDGHELDGRTMRVSEAKPKAEGGGGGGGFRGGQRNSRY